MLCDVSDSVRAASLFMLELVHAAQELFAGTRSFVFVSELAETTRIFADHGPDAALGSIYGGGVVSLAHNSNYGRALAAFEARVGRAVDRRTTVVVLGDGRTNYLADGADVVRPPARPRPRAPLDLPRGAGELGERRQRHAPLRSGGDAGAGGADGDRAGRSPAREVAARR